METSVLIVIGKWFIGLSIAHKIKDAFISLFTSEVLKFMKDRFRPAPEEKAFKRAVKMWQTHFHLSGTYNKERRIKNINEFCNYVIANHGTYDLQIDSLYDFFEKELEKTDEGKKFLHELRTKALNKDLYENLIKTTEILSQLKALHERQKKILKVLNTHNKGIREFTEVEGYIQRHCTQRLKNDEVFKYLLEHKTFESYKLVDIVSERTDCIGNKFILYSDAQSGKTTEMQQLGWELQKEGRFIPIMFKIKGCPNIRQELPAMNIEIEKGLVLIIDALDEKFEGDARLGLYNEIEAYAEEHPHMKIVLTCRENFCSEHSFKGFTELALNDLSWYDTKNYLKKEGFSYIITDIEKRRLYEFIRTPFYLVALVDFYKQKKSLPENKGELYDFFIDRRLEQEEELGLKQNAEMISKGKKILGKMTVAMQLSGTSSITKEELLFLYNDNYDNLNRVLRTGLIESTEEKGYGFTHNSFKEYFVSRYLLSFNTIDKIQNLCCYRGTKIVRTGWYNTVALMLAQIPKKSELSQLILAWIVNDNKEMVLYIDRKLFDEKQRTDIFRDIVEWHKSKSLRLADYTSSKYEDLMNFGQSRKSIDYLINELKVCKEIESHIVNVLFLLRFLRNEDISIQKAEELNKILLEVFERFKDDEEHIYVLFEVFRSPWLKTEENVDKIYSFLENSTHPNIVNHLVEYITDSGCTEKYIDVIIDKSKFIHNYQKEGCTRIVSREYLFESYLALTTWDSIKKALTQIKNDYKEHLASVDEDKYETLLGKMLDKVAVLVKKHPDAADFVYEMLLDLAEDWSYIRQREKDKFIEFFEKTGLTQHFFERTIDFLIGYFFDDTATEEDHKKIESAAYCAGLMLDGNKLTQIKNRIDFSNSKGNSLLLCLSQYSTEKMQKEIDNIRKKYYPQFWRDRNAPNQWKIIAQQEYDELMDYDRFKSKIIKIIEEKAPKNKKDMNLLRQGVIKFSREEEERLSRYVGSVFYNFYDSEKDVFNLIQIKEYIENYKEYQKLIVYYTKEQLYSDRNEIKISDKQMQLFKISTENLLKELAEETYFEPPVHESPALTVLLHHDVNIDDERLLRLLPYSYHKIHYTDEQFHSIEYCLFDYICERFVDNQTNLLNALRICMDRSVVYMYENWKAWGVYIVKKRISSEYERVLNLVIKLPCADPMLSIAIEMLENEETRTLLLKDDVMEKCGVEKRLYIYEHLAAISSLDEYVISGVEKDFVDMSEDFKGRAVRLLLLKGSMIGLEYVEENIQAIEIHTDFRNYTDAALPKLMIVYSKAIDKLDSLKYTGILHAVEDIARNSDEGWKNVNELFAALIEKDKRKFQHLNWYLRDWSVKRMEKASPVMTIEEVKNLLNN